MKINLMTKEQFATELQEHIMGGTSISNIMHLLDQWNEKDDFEAVARPVLKYLCEHHHPHMTVLITPTTAELVEGVKSIGEVMDYVKD